jgi:hypothetical protein
MCDLLECNGFQFIKLSEAVQYANFLFKTTGIIHAITQVERIKYV